MTVEKLRDKMIDSYSVTGDMNTEMHGIVTKKKEEDDLAEKRKKEEQSLEAKLIQEKKQEDLPATKQRSSVSQDGKMTEMRRGWSMMKKDALRTPTSVREIRKIVRSTATSLSPSLTKGKVASI